MFLWSDWKEGPNLKDFTVYLWDKQHLSHSTIWELMGSTRIMKPEEKDVSFRAYFALNFLSVYWFSLPCNKKKSVAFSHQAWNRQQKCRKKKQTNKKPKKTHEAVFMHLNSTQADTVRSTTLLLEPVWRPVAHFSWGRWWLCLLNGSGCNEQIKCTSICFWVRFSII